jgi:transcriptional regulator with XRE-family HTH domain
MPHKKQAVPKTLAERLSYLLKAKRMSQAVLADTLRVSQANVSRWLGGRAPETKFAVAISKRLDVSLEWLRYGIGDGPSELDAFILEIRKHRLPAIEALIATVNSKPDSILKGHAEHLEQLKSIRQSLISVAEYAEKKGEVIVPSHLENPAKYITKDKNFIVDERGALSRFSLSGSLDAHDKHAMLCSIYGLPVGASDQTIRDAHVKYMASKKRKMKARSYL